MLTVPQEQPKNLDRAILGFDVHRRQTDTERGFDSLFVLAYSFTGYQALAGINAFIGAYVHGGTIARPKPPERTQIEAKHAGTFRALQLASNRSASKARDYIFATMPQFPWYHYPANAEHIPFSDLFLDLYGQASFLAHAFACRITRSMTDSKACLEPQKAWLPIAQQPEPARLEDFMKLLGQCLSAKTPPGLDHVHLTTVVKLMEIVDGQPLTVLAVVESAMRFSERTWQESHRGGELSKYGNFPQSDWKLKVWDATYSG